MRDLMNPAATNLAVREDEHGAVVVVGARERLVTSATEAVRLLEEGSLARRYAARRSIALCTPV